MLKSTLLIGVAGCGKTITLDRVEQSLIAEGRPVIRVDGWSTANGIAQAVTRYANNPKPLPRKGLARFLPAFLFEKQYPEGPITILINDCPADLLGRLESTLEMDAYVVAVRPQ